MVFAITVGNREIVDAREALLHEPVRIEFPVLITVGAKPLAGGVVLFVGEPDGNVIVRESPDLLDQPVVQFTRPLGGQECDDLTTPFGKLCAITPLA